MKPTKKQIDDLLNSHIGAAFLMYKKEDGIMVHLDCYIKNNILFSRANGQPIEFKIKEE
jgi:hypothetical protein